MRQGPNNKRMRGRNNGRKHSNPRNQNFESNGPDVKVRGNAQQVVEKYLALARDASSAGDRISAESYYQHAEHYYRIMNANMPADQRQNIQGMDNGADDSDQDGYDQDNGYDRQPQNQPQNQPQGRQQNDNRSARNDDASSDDDSPDDSVQAEETEEVAAQDSDGGRGNGSGRNGSGGTRRRNGRGNGRRRDPSEMPQPEVEPAGADAAPSEEASESANA